MFISKHFIRMRYNALQCKALQCLERVAMYLNLTNRRRNFESNRKGLQKHNRGNVDNKSYTNT